MLASGKALHELQLQHLEPITAVRWLRGASSSHASRCDGRDRQQRSARTVWVMTVPANSGSHHAGHFRVTGSREASGGVRCEM